jgi:nucleoside-diphosphate-sugar epimerase
MGMRAFVTGGSGFIGSHLIDALLKNGWQVSALAHRQPIQQESRITILRGDIADSGPLKTALKGTDVLFHLASAMGASRIGKDEFLAINAKGTEAVLEAAREAGVRRVVHCSSAGIFGSVKKGDIADETYPPDPIQVYDQTKFEGENIARRFAEHGMDIIIVRPGWTYGPRDRRTFKLIRAIHDRRFILPGMGDARQTPVYVGDLVAGILLASESGQRGEVYHIAGGEIMTAREIVMVIAAACGTRIHRIRLPLPASRIAAGVLEIAFLPFRREAPLTRAKLSFFTQSKPLSIAKAERELGFAPAVDFQDGMATTINWYRAAGWL